MKAILIFFSVMIGGMIYLHHSLQNGTVLRYIDTHAQDQGIRESTYYIGQGYYLFQNLQDAATYFIRVSQRYPKHALADDANFSYLQCLEDSVRVNRSELVAGYKAYLENFPNGRHAELAKSRMDAYATGGR